MRETLLEVLLRLIKSGLNEDEAFHLLAKLLEEFADLSESNLKDYIKEKNYT